MYFCQTSNVKPLIFLFLFGCTCSLNAQTTGNSDYVFLVMTDGFRWQEVFSGADSAMINDQRMVKDVELTRQMYWDSTAEGRRKKLLPFFWQVIASKGQLYGNRSLDNKVSVSNPYKISYPGYSEILTGWADPLLIPNLSLNNRNTNLLESLNRNSRFNGQVVAFGSWKVFPYIFNSRRSNIPVNSGYMANKDDADSTDGIIDQLQNATAHQSNTRHDLLTYSCAKEYIINHHPSVVFIGFGETDESAHSGRYDLYLQHASAVDRMISELWYFIQTDPHYKGHSTLIITTDHGRGNRQDTWHKHGTFTKGSGETWIALLGAGINARGEMSAPGQIYAKQVAGTISQLLGADFDTDRSIGKAIPLPGIQADQQSSIAGRASK
jgi:hypothetical protein